MIPPENEPSTILIVEAEPLVRRALNGILSGQADLTVVAEAASGNDAVRLARVWRPEVVLIDLQAPRLGGCATIQRILADYPGAHVVVLTTLDTDELLFEAISSGAEAYLLKDANEQEIVAAIRAVIRGESCLAPNMARKLLNEFRRIRPVAKELPNEPLTNREARILEFVVEGRSNKEIAGAVFLAEGTVKNYVSRIMEKLNVRTRTQLAIMGLRNPTLTNNNIKKRSISSTRSLGSRAMQHPSRTSPDQQRSRYSA